MEHVSFVTQGYIVQAMFEALQAIDTKPANRLDLEVPKVVAGLSPWMPGGRYKVTVELLDR